MTFGQFRLCGLAIERKEEYERQQVEGQTRAREAPAPEPLRPVR